MAKNGEGESGESDDVVLMVCLKCGTEVQLEGAQDPPPDMECEKCGNQVFRRFDGGSTEADEEDESREDFRDSTERDTATDAGGGEVSRQDLMDLNNP